MSTDFTDSHGLREGAFCEPARISIRDNSCQFVDKASADEMSTGLARAVPRFSGSSGFCAAVPGRTNRLSRRGRADTGNAIDGSFRQDDVPRCLRARPADIDDGPKRPDDLSRRARPPDRDRDDPQVKRRDAASFLKESSSQFVK